MLFRLQLVEYPRSIPSRRLPFPTKLVRRATADGDDPAYALEVLAAGPDSEPHPVIVVSIRSIPITSADMLDTLLQIAHESFIESIEVQLEDGRSIDIPR